jgi:hypothetical protein
METLDTSLQIFFKSEFFFLTERFKKKQETNKHDWVAAWNISTNSITTWHIEDTQVKFNDTRMNQFTSSVVY